MDTKSTAEPIEEYDALEQVDAVRQYMEWDIDRLRACIVEMQEIISQCDCRTKRMIAKTI